MRSFSLAPPRPGILPLVGRAGHTVVGRRARNPSQIRNALCVSEQRHHPQVADLRSGVAAAFHRYGAEGERAPLLDAGSKAVQQRSIATDFVNATAPVVAGDRLFGCAYGVALP